MPSTYSSSLRLELQAAGENRTTWGVITNTTFNLIESAVAGVSTVAMGNANVTLTTNNGSADQARAMSLVLTGSHTAVRTVTIPAQPKMYIVRNATTGGYAITVSNGSSSVNVPASATAVIHTNGTTVWHTTNYVYDDQLMVVDPTDSTKRVRIDAGSVTTGNTRVLTMTDRDLTGSLLVSGEYAMSLSSSQKAQARANIGSELGAGIIAFFGANSAPTGWLKCNGAAVSRTTYSDLFTAISTTFGSGDGSTTFNVPELRGEFVRGWDDSRGVDTSRVFGSAQGDLLEDHTHSGGITTGAGAGGNGGAWVSQFASTGLVNTAGVPGTETRPRNIALLGCIKY